MLLVASALALQLLMRMTRTREEFLGFFPGAKDGLGRIGYERSFRAVGYERSFRAVVGRFPQGRPQVQHLY